MIILPWCALLILTTPLTVTAEEPHPPLPASGRIGGDWSFKAGAELDADGRPDPKRPKPGWSWGIHISGSFHFTWGDTAPGAAVPIDADKWEARIIELTNAERTKVKQPPYKVDPILMKLAREQSAHMARLKQISHELEGRTFSLRMKDAGYKALAAGENCAEGADSPEEAIADWLMSEGHKQNMLSERYTHVGVGMAKDADGRHYFTQVFSKPFEDRAVPNGGK